MAAPNGKNPFDLCADNELRERLARAIQQLPENEQRVLALHYYEELTRQEVGEVLHVGESRISQIHTLAMSHLRPLLQATDKPKANPFPLTAERGGQLERFKSGEAS